MRLLVISHKETWATADGFATIGGFARQLAALCELFTETTLMATIRRGSPPSHLQSLTGHRLGFRMLPEPRGVGWARKALLPWWLLVHLPTLWQEIGRADVVHALVPGDVGGLGLVLAWARRKRLFVRHCGTWGSTATISDHLRAWVLPRLAGPRTVVLATGGGETPPCPRVPRIRWIFATSMTADELERLPLACRWGPGDPLRLVTVGRLTSGKNVRAIIEALPRILDQQPGATVDIVGDGPERVLLIELSKRLGLEEKVRFHGNVSHDQVLEILCSSSLFVFPTQVAEGCPKAVVEALACSLPVVASAVSIVPLLLREGAGVLLEDGSASGVAAGVLAAVSSGASYRRMAEQAHESPRALTLEAWRDGIGECLEEEWGPLTVDSALRSTSYFPNLSSHASEKGADHGAPPVPGRALPFDRESDS